MKLFIFGGAGMIGQAIAKEHLDKGDEVFFHDNFSNTYHEYINLKGEFVKDWKQFIKEEKPDIISFQASLVSVGQSQYQIERYINNNIGFLGNVLQYLLDVNYLGKIIHASSMSIYGEGTYFCKECNQLVFPKFRKEIHPICPDCNNTLPDSSFLLPLCDNPVSIYGLTKQTQEKMLEIFSNTYNIPVTSLRYFSVFSMDGNPLNPHTGVLSIIANKILNSDKIELNEDGYQTRDLICDIDVARVHYSATKINEKYIYSMYQVGNEESCNLWYISLLMSQKLNNKKEIVFNEKVRKGDVRHSLANITKIQNKLNYTPHFRLEPGINLYCQYINDNRKLFTLDKDTCSEADKLLKNKGIL
jgi:nucleoside-diphosphate-sugar epimerase